jgi:hypothetical protein
MDAEWKDGSLSDESLDRALGGVCDPSCGVTEEEFPRLNRCCARDGCCRGARYRGLCPGCSAWTSIPEGASLTTASIIECERFGYIKRIKE